MRRDLPIPWSVSLPCVAALGALLFGWHALAKKPRPLPPAAQAQPPPSSPPAASRSSPPPAPPPVPFAVGDEVPYGGEPSPSDGLPWIALPLVAAGDLPDEASGAAARALLQWRDRRGARASGFFVHKIERARVVVVIGADDRDGCGRELARELAAFSERLQARVLGPARIDAARRPWVDLFVGDPQEGCDFNGIVAAATGPLPLAAIGERQLRGALAGGPELHVLPWVVAGAAGVAALENASDALAAAGPLPSLAALVRWSEREPTPELLRGATSFAAFCLVRGPRDAAATGFFELLRLDATLLPGGDEARAAEIAARLGATRLEELEAAWRAARR
jgi:hypothetical protein